MSRYKPVARYFIALVIITLCVVGLYWFKHMSMSNQQQSQTQHKSALLSLAAQSMHPVTIDAIEEAPGRVVAFRTAEIRPQVNGIITKRIFKEGTYVEEDTPLYQIDPALYQAAYDNAKADLLKTTVNLDAVTTKNLRYQKLIQSATISKQEYDDNQAALAQAKAEVEIAKAALQEAKINLDYTKIYAPISGQISKSFVSEGALVTANQSDPLATITQIDPIYVDVMVASTALMRLRSKLDAVEDTPVTLLLENRHTYEHTGKLQFLESTVDTTTDTIPSRTLFDNPKHMLLPGLFVHVQFKVPYENIYLIPQAATVYQPDGSLAVWVIEQKNTAQLHKITAHRMNGPNWIVESGIKEGDIIITEGLINLYPGVKVKPILKNNTQSEK